MSGSEHFTRLAASIVAAGLLGLVIAKPDAGRTAAEHAAALKTDPAPAAERVCEKGVDPLRVAFAPIDDILSISPLGEVTAPGEQLPAPAIRLNTRKGETAFDRRVTAALAPARADIVAIERRTLRDADGGAARESWSVRLQVCQSIIIDYEDLDAIEDEFIARAGGLSSFAEIGGPDHLAAKTQIRVRQGEKIGSAAGFDVVLEDRAAAPAALERPERYQTNSYVEGTAISAPPAILEAITSDASRIQCPLDYLPENIARDWKAKLGDAWGMRRAKGENACRTALVDIPGAAQGAWFTDASHNGRTSKVSAIALAPDAIDPERMIFALHGRVRSLTADMVGLNPMLEEAREEAARDFLTFDQADGRINLPFDKVRAGEVFCYEGLRANFVGPRINGVILLSIDAGATAPLMRIEARADAMRCIDLPEPWAFTGAETTFYR
ncbi:MAG: hypothetical protein KDE05_14195 [Parvularculaceae bacterium]|nr:hypothetical protein [Parvularculaceae bacterium]